jgi:hypothetical protein
MTTYIALADYVQSRAGIAILASVIGGAVVTAIWTEICYLLLRKSYPDQFTGVDRSPWIGRIVGIFRTPTFDDPHIMVAPNSWTNHLRSACH